MPSLLSNVRIIDLSRMLAGPYGSMLLGDLGAEVIKIEEPAGDFTRIPVQYSMGGIGAYFLAINRNKKSIVLDLTTPQGREVLHDFVKVSDVVFDNLRPAVLKKVGADYETLKRINSRIISCSVTGFGQDGPDRDLPAYDLTIQARGGAMGITGERGGAPVRMGLPMGDLAGGMFAAYAIAAALFARERTGQGRRLDISLLDCQASLMTYMATFHTIGGLIPKPQGSSHEVLVPYQAFQTKDLYLVVACPTEKFWQALCRAIGRKDLISHPHFKDALQRIVHREELYKVLQEIFITKTVDEWMEALRREDVPSSPVNTLDRVMSDPQLLYRHMIVEVEHATSGKFKCIGNPVKASDAEETFSHPPLLGEHTEEILRDLLGYGSQRIGKLIQEKVIFQAAEEVHKILKMI
ncbi:MAG: CoA transferase [Desulfobacterales bacterium]|jgi:crotonobetainyl-CoA:carnitine CoA-transferase CaiB-like acyl-CoA transferase|nr:CoA transferase [Desulfobacterales bacterium]